MRDPGLTILLALACACGGGGGGGGTQATGSPGPTGAAGAPGAAGATGGGGASGAATVGIERLDPSAECDALVPAEVPAPVDVQLTPPAGASCAGGLADGTGHLAVAARAGGGAIWQVFRRDGSTAGAFSAWPLVPAPSGWHGLRVDAGAPGTPIEHVHASAEGAPGTPVPVNGDPEHLQSAVWSLAQDPQGGSLALVGEIDRFHNHFTTLEAQRFDAAGAARWGKNLRLDGNGDHAFAFLAAGVSTQGEGLILWQRSAFVDVLWLDLAGAVVVPRAEVERSADVLGSAGFRSFALELVPLLDGGLALRADGRFQRTYARRAVASSPLPAWLASRADWTFRFTRGDRGYALLPPAGRRLPGCDEEIDLVAPSGRLCGRVTLRGQGADCTSGAVDQGRDGTVVQQREQEGCGYRFWPRLLAR